MNQPEFTTSELCVINVALQCYIDDLKMTHGHPPESWENRNAAKLYQMAVDTMKKVDAAL